MENVGAAFGGPQMNAEHRRGGYYPPVRNLSLFMQADELRIENGECRGRL